MSMSPLRSLLLTFDVEDFVNNRSIKSLHRILKMLEKNKLKALFFITGHMAEKLAGHKEILDLLCKHEIGYHSSSHSVRPTILEYTDVEDYEKARLESIKRENSHINSLTGDIEGKGGINVLQELFPNNRIEAFRAPDYCWSPPHLEALNALGIVYDFSTKISREPVSYMNITFYPYPIYHNWNGKAFHKELIHSILAKRITVLNSHPWYFVNSKAWNHIYGKGNPGKLSKVTPRSYKAFEQLFSTFELMLKKIQILQRMNIIEVTPKLEKSKTNLEINKVSSEKMCKEVASWFQEYYGYKTRFLCDHFRKFFKKIGN